MRTRVSGRARTWHVRHACTAAGQRSARAAIRTCTWAYACGQCCSFPAHLECSQTFRNGVKSLEAQRSSTYLRAKGASCECFEGSWTSCPTFHDGWPSGKSIRPSVVELARLTHFLTEELRTIRCFSKFSVRHLRVVAGDFGGCVAYRTQDYEGRARRRSIGCT